MQLFVFWGAEESLNLKVGKLYGIFGLKPTRDVRKKMQLKEREMLQC